MDAFTSSYNPRQLFSGDSSPSPMFAEVDSVADSSVASEGPIRLSQHTDDSIDPIVDFEHDPIHVPYVPQPQPQPPLNGASASKQTKRNLFDDFDSAAKAGVRPMANNASQSSERQDPDEPVEEAPAETRQQQQPPMDIDEARAREIYLRSVGAQKDMIGQWQSLLRQIHAVEVMEKERHLQRRKDAIRDEERLMEVRRREIDVLVAGLTQRERDLGRESERVSAQLREPSFKEQEARMEERSRNVEARLEEMHRLYATVEDRRNRLRQKEVDLESRERQLVAKESEWMRRMRETERQLHDRQMDVERRETQAASWMRSIDVRERDVQRREAELRQCQTDLARRESNLKNVNAPATGVQRAEELYNTLERLGQQLNWNKGGKNCVDVESLDRDDDDDDDAYGSSGDHEEEEEGSYADESSPNMQGATCDANTASEFSDGEDHHGNMHHDAAASLVSPAC